MTDTENERNSDRERKHLSNQTYPQDEILLKISNKNKSDYADLVV